MLKKIIIIGSLLIITTVVVLLVMPWGEYQSDLEKTELTEEIVYSEDENIPPSLDELEGEYTIVAGENIAAEIMFLTDGLKDTKGGFEEFTISFDIAEDFKQSTLSVIIKTASLNSGNAMRDKHLAEEDFFHTEKYPEITYVSSAVTLGDTSYIAKGQLTLNGTTKRAGCSIQSYWRRRKRPYSF